MKKHLILFIALVLILSNCKKEEDKEDPFDPSNIDPSEWAPSNLQLEQLSVSSVKLTWEDNCSFEDGFKIDKKTNTQEWTLNYKTVNSNTIYWNDTIVKPYQNIQYRIFAYKDNQNSLNTEKAISIEFSPPSNLTFYMPTPTSIKLTWDDNTIGENGFKIDKKVGNNPWQIMTGDTDADINNWIDSDIAFGSVIKYKVYAFYNGINSEAISNEITATIPPPSNFHITQTDITQATLNWSDQCGFEEGFKIDKKIGNSAWEFEIVSLVQNTTEWIDNNAVFGETNYYRVYSIYNEFESSKTEANVSFILQAPSSLDLLRTDITQVKLLWNDESTFEEGIKIDRKIGSNNWEIGYGEVNGNIEIWYDNYAVFGQNNKYRIYAVNGQYNSNNIESSINIGLDSPSNMELQQLDATKVKLTWNDNSNFEDGFKIERKVGSGNWGIIGNTSANVDTWTDNDAPFEQSITYKVYAYANSYNSNDIQSNIFLTIPTPSNLNLQHAGINNVLISWNDNCSFEDGYKMDRKIGNGSWENEIAVLGSNNTSWTDQDLPFNENIVYRVYTYSDNYTSNKIEDNIELTIPAPTDLDIIQTGLNTIKLTWQDNCSFEEGFVIDRKVEGNDWELNYGNAIPNQTEYIDNTFPLSVNVLYRVYAIYYYNKSEHVYISVLIESFEQGIPSNYYVDGWYLTNQDEHWGSTSLRNESYNQDAYVITNSYSDGNAKIGFYWKTHICYGDEAHMYFYLNDELYQSSYISGDCFVWNYFQTEINILGSYSFKWMPFEESYTRIDDIIIIDYNPNVE